jgi:hypothetical protein
MSRLRACWSNRRSRSRCRGPLHKPTGVKSFVSSSPGSEVAYWVAPSGADGHEPWGEPMRNVFAVGLLFTVACSSSSTTTKLDANDSGGTTDGASPGSDAASPDAGDEAATSGADAESGDATFEAEAAAAAGNDAGGVTDGGNQDGAAAMSDAASGADGAACLPASNDCTSAPNTCCSGICVLPANAMEHAFCADPCTSGTACASGCCTTLTNTGQTACAGRGFCAATCAAPGAACTTPYDCCAGATCVTTNGGSCASICTLGSQCVSGCCAPLTNASISVCSAPQFCTD